ncbi:transcriptional regulator family: Fungal Specific TF [Aspergillus niger]|nr:transcriptional regulator family: Fungal Specific TF [Aspergillus niger]KAI2846111.1 transcriptional regulator family: Fungal Specific TF [Aspergillus niger]KAI2929946.1 transcriptional regulator family: Fungal Specific TF [Aspergillus niger]KAI2968447.1 transcriptional regulator family: Fungal Specific TF [Aspergillus niger]KAI2987565.1 transcriptional regulator family: Fungal Specific TF [Aspergillus niger]
MMPAPFSSSECTYLYRYFASTILPRFVRRNSLDKTHMLRLAPQFSPLFGAMVAVAGMQLPTKDRWPAHLALQSYLHAIHTIQMSLTDITKAACDDRILATVSLLACFESCRSDATPTVAPHVTAAGLLLTQRRPCEFRTKAAATFDRICVESFLYQACLMMIFDPTLDALPDNREQLELPLYFDRPTRSDSTPGETVLQASYKFFLLIADVTKLSRLSRPLDSAEVAKWRSLNWELSRWSHLVCSADMSLALCYLALQILLHKANPNITSSERVRRVHSCLAGGLQRVPALEIDIYPPVYLLWPMAILGSVAVRLEEMEVFRDVVASISAAKLGGHAAWVQTRLDRVWKTIGSAPEDPKASLVGLQLLLDQG